MPGAVTPWKPRGDDFYEDLRREQPRKFSHRGVHAKYGGPVSCHAYEHSEPVHSDAERVHQRELVEHSGGQDADIHGTNKDFGVVLERHRASKLRRPKGFIFSDAAGEEWDGKWLKKMDEWGAMSD